MRVTSRPNNSMRPSVTGSAPAIRLNSVVLPAPLGPMSARRSPGRTASSTPSTARSPPKTFETRSRRSAQSLRRRASLTVLARRIVAAVQRPLQVLVRLVLPELGDGRVGGDDGVLQPVLALDLPDVDVLDHAVVVVDAERATWRVLQRDLSQRGQHGVAVVHLATGELRRLHDPAGVRVGGLRVVRSHLARLRLERFGELL